VSRDVSAHLVEMNRHLDNMTKAIGEMNVQIARTNQVLFELLETLTPKDKQPGPEVEVHDVDQQYIDPTKECPRCESPLTGDDIDIIAEGTTHYECTNCHYTWTV
jgi:hypothetical protein